MEFSWFSHQSPICKTWAATTFKDSEFKGFIDKDSVVVGMKNWRLRLLFKDFKTSIWHLKDYSNQILSFSCYICKLIGRVTFTWTLRTALPLWDIKWNPYILDMRCEYLPQSCKKSQLIQALQPRVSCLHPLPAVSNDIPNETSGGSVSHWHSMS